MPRELKDLSCAYALKSHLQATHLAVRSLQQLPDICLLLQAPRAQLTSVHNRCTPGLLRRLQVLQAPRIKPVHQRARIHGCGAAGAGGYQPVTAGADVACCQRAVPQAVAGKRSNAELLHARSSRRLLAYTPPPPLSLDAPFSLCHCTPPPGKGVMKSDGKSRFTTLMKCAIICKMIIHHSQPLCAIAPPPRQGCYEERRQVALHDSGRQAAVPLHGHIHLLRVHVRGEGGLGGGEGHVRGEGEGALKL